MGQHTSLKSKGGGATKKRSVMKRFERIEVLKSNGQWKDGDRVVGLRKTKTV
jgi:small basic protein (TIGR04137 family)